FDRVTSKLQNTPGILSVAINSGAPLAPGSPMNQSFTIEGRAADSRDVLPTADLNFVSPGCFKLLGIPLVRGRAFTEHDNADAARVLTISQSLAKHYFPNEDPIGHRLSGDNGENWVEIVGVVGDVKYYGLDKDALDTAYLPAAQGGAMASSLLIKTAGDPMN